LLTIADDREQANRWRADFFRTVFPKKRTVQAPLALENTTAAIKLAGRSFAERFVKGAARHLLKIQSHPSLIDSLASLYVRAGELSTGLHTQLPELDVRNQNSALGLPFYVRDCSMEAHRLHQLLHDTDTSVDGRIISLVLNPLVQITGNDDGEGYGERARILAKACVWMRDWVDPQC